MTTKNLRPVEQVTRANSELRQIRSPRLSGWLLQIAVWLLESLLGSLILRSFWRKSGVIEVLRETEVPELASFEPVWPPPETGAAGINIEELDCATRAAVAAQTIPGSVRESSKGLKPAKATRKSQIASTAGFSAIRDAPEGEERLRRWEIADYSQAYTIRLATPTGVAESILRCLEQLQQAEPQSHVLTAQDPEDLLQQARASSSRHLRGKPLSPLDGVPFAVIDCIDAVPYPTTAGTTYLASERVVAEDAPCIAALRQAGAMLVGKATLHELGIGMTGLNPRAGTARNPYDANRCAGGSSSGSAALVSTGICAFALGTDGGGSLRVPAALCGVVGLKPTTGRTSREGCPSSAFSIMSHGVIAASVGDAMLVNAVISNAGTSSLLHRPAPTTVLRRLYDDTPNASKAAKPLRGTKLGVFSTWVQGAGAEALRAFKAAIKEGARLGCEVVDIEIPELELVRVAQMAAIGCEIAEGCKAAYRDPKRRLQMNLETRMTLANTSRFLATDFLQAQKIRTRLLTHMRRLFKEVDCIASPTVGISAPPISEAAARVGESDMALLGELMRFTIPVNMSGVPAISIPIGQDSQGLPLALQLIGLPWREADLLFTASALEAALRTPTKLPRTSFDVLFGKTS